MKSHQVKLRDGRRVVLRVYQPSDWERLVEFYASLSSEVLRWSLPPYSRERIKAWTSSPDQHIILLGEFEGSLVGHLQIFQQTSPRMKGVGELIIYLHQGFLNAGLGTAMTREALELAKGRGINRVGLTVVAENRSAIRVYEKVGFVREGIRKGAYLAEDGLYHDTVEMGIILPK